MKCHHCEAPADPTSLWLCLRCYHAGRPLPATLPLGGVPLMDDRDDNSDGWGQGRAQYTNTRQETER